MVIILNIGVVLTSHRRVWTSFRPLLVYNNRCQIVQFTYKSR